MNQRTTMRGLAVFGLFTVLMAGCATSPASASDDAAIDPTVATATLESAIAHEFTLERADGAGAFSLSEQLEQGPVVLTIIDTGIG